MSNVGAGTTWNLPNFTGEIITASPIETPVLSMIGGMSGGGKTTNNFEFPVAQTYDQETAAQPAITETASLTLPTAVSYVRAQQKNVAGIHQEQVSLSYERMSNQGRLSGIATAGSVNPVTEEEAWQIQSAFRQIAMDIEVTILQGAYQIATSAAVANKSRGLIECASDASNTVAAGSIDLSEELINELIRTMHGNGSKFLNMHFIVNAYQAQQLSDIYGLAPRDRVVGGVSIKEVIVPIIPTPIGVILDKHQPAATVTLADLAPLAPVFQPVPGKGNFFVEPVAKDGASNKSQIYGKFGLDHGANFLHGTITGLTTS